MRRRHRVKQGSLLLLHGQIGWGDGGRPFGDGLRVVPAPPRCCPKLDDLSLPLRPLLGKWPVSPAAAGGLLNLLAQDVVGGRAGNDVVGEAGGSRSELFEALDNVALCIPWDFCVQVGQSGDTVDGVERVESGIEVVLERRCSGRSSRRIRF